VRGDAQQLVQAVEPVGHVDGLAEAGVERGAQC
jgi:hypothetical protein